MARRRNDNAKKVRRIAEKFENAKDDIAAVLATEAQQHFKDSFKNEGFTDATLDPWKARKLAQRQSRPILTDREHLQDSILIVSQRWSHIEVASKGVDYAHIHNFGGTIEVPVTDQMRKFFWAKYKKTGVEAYKWMALTSKNRFTIEIPQRRFMGDSRVMRKKMRKVVADVINHHIKRR